MGLSSPGLEARHDNNSVKIGSRFDGPRNAISVFVGMLERLLGRLGFVRLRRYNLRLTASGFLAPINSRYPVPIDFGGPRSPAPIEAVNTLWPEIPQLAGPPPKTDGHQFAEGTADGLEPVSALDPVSGETGDPSPLASPRTRAKSDTIPDPHTDPNSES